MCWLPPIPSTLPRPQRVRSVLAFTRNSFVDSGIVHQSILFLALDTSFTAPPLYFAIDIEQYMGSPQAPCVAIQHAILILVFQYRV